MIFATSSVRAEPVHRDLVRDDLLGAGREHRGVDLAGRDRVDAHAVRAEVGRHLARQRGERGLRGGIGGARERMHARARDRGDVDDRALGARELLDQAARQHDRRKEVDAEHLAPDVDVGVDRAHARAAVGLRRDRGVVDERVQLAVFEAALDLGDRVRGVRDVAEVDLDVILGPGFPRTVFRERMARAGDDAPARGREALHRRMPDAAAGAGQQQRAARRWWLALGIGLVSSAAHVAARSILRLDGESATLRVALTGMTAIAAIA